MPLGSLPRASVLRGVAVVVITGAITLAAACSDEDVVDTIPPPRPNATSTTDEPVDDAPEVTEIPESDETTRSLSTPSS